ncbi:hypothetical protein CK203_033723 [Vitis vinifera]|uniref:Uncharacterized protein n=1 Tax=Vitis vinifera TaxID=29760 RepID=A0A438HSK9_VITVI|nr:hypothetical protein CK203_033723 [Vitis vinifera]
MSPFFELNIGAKIPSVGLGTWRADHGLIGDALATAIKVSLPIRVTSSFPSFSIYKVDHQGSVVIAVPNLISINDMERQPNGPDVDMINPFCLEHFQPHV